MKSSDDRKREELLKFLSHKVFDPILQALPEDYKSEDLIKKLHNVKRRTENEKHQFYQFATAEEVKTTYLADLDFRKARKIDHDLDELTLPSLTKVKDDFLGLCEQLRV
jgi:hypothetical protein